MKPQIEVERVELEAADPTFKPGTSHIAHARVTNPSSTTFTYTGDLYLGDHVVSASASFTLTPGQTKTIDFTITMPGAEGAYKVYLDIYVGADLIAAYVATEDVIIEVEPAIDVGPISWD